MPQCHFDRYKKNRIKESKVQPLQLLPPNYTLLKGARQAIKSYKIWMKPCQIQVHTPKNLQVQALNLSSTQGRFGWGAKGEGPRKIEQSY